MTDSRGTGSHNAEALLLLDARKEDVYRLSKYLAWLDAHGRPWFELDLAAYRDYLLKEGLSKTTIAAHLSTVRRRYRDLLKDRERFVELLSRQKNIKSGLDEIVFNIMKAIDPAQARVAADPTLKGTFRIINDVQRRNYLRMVQHVVRLSSSTVFTEADPFLVEARDIALLDLMFATGVRESEVISLKVEDLHQSIMGVPAMGIRQSRGSKIRFTPYLDGDIPGTVLKWIEAGNLMMSDWLFRTFHHGGRVMRPGHMKLAAVRQILERYPLELGAGPEPVVIKSTDMRASYAWLAHQKGESIEAIAQYLGASVQMVERFVSGVQNGSE